MDGLPGLPPGGAPAGGAPLREESVQNAVAFLQHPKVQPSATEYKRAFLEKKGLSGAEISEAFRRVPEPPPGSVAAPADYAAPPPQAVQYAPPPPPPGLSWSQVALRAGLVAGGALAAKRTLAPLAQPYFRQLADYVGLRSADADAAAARERAALAAATAALDSKASAVASSLDDVKALLRRVEAAAATPPPQPPSELSPAIRDALRDIKDDLRSELRAVADRVAASPAPSPAAQQQQHAAQHHGGHPSPGYLTPAPAAAVAHQQPSLVVAAAAAATPGDDVRAELAEIKALLAAGRARDGAEPPPLPPRTVTRYAALQGEAVSPATPADAWAASPGESPSSASASASSGGRGSARGTGPPQAPGAPPPSPPPHSERYLAVLQAIESGQTPPGIRDIDDRAPNPSAPPPAARMAPPAKPWERAGSGAEAGASGSSSSGGAFDGRGLPAAPWAPRGGSGVRITVLDGENGGGNATRQAAPWVPQRGQGGVAETGGWTPPKVPGASSAAAAKALGLPVAGEDAAAASPGAATQEANGGGG